LRTHYSHWLPLPTRCPLHWAPDFGYVEVEADAMVEVYGLRKLIFSFAWQRTFIEKLAESVLEGARALAAPGTKIRVTYRMLGGRMAVSVGEV
jgi:NADPH-dependent 7-cyano-7-deazaguanine reductase QueF